MLKKIMLMNIPFLMVIMFMLSSCASVPVMELDAAKKAIIESEKINAEKYAPEELNSAKRLYTTATNQVTEKQNKFAKDSAINSKMFGDKAYYKSLDEFIKDQNDGTEKTMSEAKDSHADVAAADKYKEAEALFNEVQQEMNKLKSATVNLQQLQTGIRGSSQTNKEGGNK
jgi:hypothetical protein